MSPILRRRLIEDTDLDAIAGLLAAGFPQHDRGWWQSRLARLRLRAAPEGFPRYGRLLETRGRVVGALLTIHSRHTDAEGRSFVRCNLSSWYVEAAVAGHASLLLGASLKDRSVTYINISPALHTQPIIEAQGFRPFAEGSLATMPALVRRRERARVRPFVEGEAWEGVDRRLLEDHAAFGCLCLAVEAADGTHPFVFSAPRPIRHFLQAVQLLYCRDITQFVRFAGVLGRELLRRGSTIVLVDGPRRLTGLPSRQVFTSQKKYFAGDHPPRPGDLAYTELGLFG